MLPEPMLSRPGPIPKGPGWRYEVKWDGFRALVSTVDGLRVRSRRGWNMTELLPELRQLPGGLVLDGEIVAWKKGVPHFPFLTRRLLNGDRSIAVTFMAFDLLEVDGRSLLGSPHSARRALLERGDRPSGKRQTEPRYLDRDQIDALLAELGDEFRPLAATLAFAGLRVSEALALRFREST